MAPPTILLPEQEQSIVTEYVAGVDGTHLAQKYGIGRMVVYRALRRNGVDIHRSRICLKSGLRRCGWCLQTKPLDQFHRCGQVMRRGLSDRRSICGPCITEYGRLRGDRIKSNTGLSLEQYQALSSAQGGKCALTDTDHADDTRTLEVDHDHATGEVRGLLCGRCNRRMIHVDRGKYVQTASLGWNHAAQEYKLNARTGLKHAKHQERMT